jgi:hypothetical protein
MWRTTFTTEFGAFINKDRVNANEGLNVLWLTDRVRTEKVVLLHEVGHTLHLKDLYAPECSELTMYSYGAYGETKKRTLDVGDIAGVSRTDDLLDSASEFFNCF